MKTPDSETQSFTFKKHRMKSFPFFLAFFLFFSFSLPGQSSGAINDFVKNGIRLHDAGDYEAAIAEYKKALKLDPKSGLVLYEMGLSYYASGNYGKAVSYANKALKYPGKHARECYTLKGNALDKLDKASKALRVYDEGIRLYPDYHLLYFNKGVTLYRLGKTQKAIPLFIESLNRDLGHAGSHYLLGMAQSAEGNRVEGMLSLYLFLLFEPDSDRSSIALGQLYASAGEGVSGNEQDGFQINLSPKKIESDFAPAETYLSFKEVARQQNPSGESGEIAWFAEVTEGLFDILADLSEKGHSGFYWDKYVPFFVALNEAGHTEAFCFFISQNKGEEAAKWLEANQSKLDLLFDWLNAEEKQN